MAYEKDEARRDLRMMLLDVALGKYPNRDAYVHPTEQRIPAAAALLRDIHAEKMEMTTELVSALEECMNRLPEGE